MPLVAAPLFRKMLTVAFVLALPLRTVQVAAVAASAAASTTQCEMEVSWVCPLELSEQSLVVISMDLFFV